MKISKDTIALLSNFDRINSNIFVKTGNVIRTISVAKDVYAEAEVSESFPSDFGIYNLREFLSHIGKLFDSPDYDFNKRFVIITEGLKKTKYFFAEPSLLTLPPDNTDNLKNAPVFESFDLSSDEVSDIIKANSSLSISDVCFVADGSKIYARLMDSKNADSSSFELDLDAETDKEFSVFIRIEKLMHLFAGESYTVSISRSGVAKFVAKDTKLAYYFAVESNSKI